MLVILIAVVVLFGNELRSLMALKKLMIEEAIAYNGVFFIILQRAFAASHSPRIPAKTFWNGVVWL